MGAKSTIELKRDSAEDIYVARKLEAKERKLRAKAVAMTDTELEYALEAISDEEGGLRNYCITSHPYNDG